MQTMFVDNMTALAKFREIAAYFEQHDIDDPAREAEILITGVLRIGRAALYTGDVDVPETVMRHIDALAKRRIQGEPLQYLVGHVEFFGLTIYVGPGVLIPRPETELLVEETLKAVRRSAYGVQRENHKESLGAVRSTQNAERPLRILDLCTGSGCIALALARNLPEALVYGVDSSEAAMVYATQNALANDIRNVRFKLGDLFGPVDGLRFDCIVSNPPYVRHDEIETLQVEIREHEPVEALDGGRDGLDFYRKIFRDAVSHLVENGIIMLEIGFGQAAAIRELAMRSGFTQVNFIKDFAGIERIMVAERKWS